jgi:hypothetical protein
MSKYGKVVFSQEIEGIAVDVSLSRNPFGEHYLIVSSGDQIISGTVIDKKKEVVEFKNKPIGSVKISKDGKTETTETSPRTL